MPVEEKTDQREADEKVVEIERERLRSFTNHPFKVQADSQMIELQDSIRKYGILNPLIVRPRPEGVYEIISGHRRKFAAEKLGYRKVPVIIRAMKDDEAVVSMVDSNLQRERISPSEKAFAYKMKYDAIKRKTGRRKCGQVDHHSGKKSIEVIGEEGGDSPKQVQRYIKITGPTGKIYEEIMTRLADQFSDNQVEYEVITYNFRKKDHLDLASKFKNNGNKIAYQACSSGQKTVLDVNFLSKIATRLGILVMDEFLKHLDPANHEICVDLIKSMNIGCTMLSSHMESIAAFNNKSCHLELNDSGVTKINLL